MSIRNGKKDSLSDGKQLKSVHLKGPKRKKAAKQRESNTANTMILHPSDSDVDEYEFEEEEVSKSYNNDNDNEYDEELEEYDDEEYQEENGWTEDRIYAEYDENFEEYLDDDEYAASPPKKKKYRESDAKIKPLKYNDAKKQRNSEIADKHKKRYSKYGSEILLLDDMDALDSEHNDDKKEKIKPEPIKTPDIKPKKKKKKKDKKTKHHKKKKKKHKNKRNSNLRESITNEVNERSLNAQYSPYSNDRKELSLFYNKKTQDKYDEFEMNTYSTDSADSDSDALINKYKNLKTPPPITPAPNILEKGLNDITNEDGIDDEDDDQTNIDEKPQVK